MDYKGLFDVYKKRLDYVYHKSALFNKEFIHNIRQSGDSVEVEVRNLFKQILPQRYKVTSGYIVSIKNKAEPVSVSGQIDMIIVDTMVPHSIFSLDDKQDVEVVPVEAVIGIFEIKRTLTIESLENAIQHLKETCEKTHITKTNTQHYFPGGVCVGRMCRSRANRRLFIQSDLRNFKYRI